MTGANPGQGVVAVLLVTALLACDARSPMPRLATFDPDPDVVRIETDRDVELGLRATPRILVAIVTRKGGTTDTVAITSVNAEDTAIVRVVNHALVPRRVGRSDLMLVVSGYPITARVQVTDQVADEPIALSPGEVRAWQLVPGWYEIAVRRADTTLASPLELAAPLTCVPMSRDPDAISCLVRDSTRLVLKHTGRGGRARAHVAIRQVQ